MTDYIFALFYFQQKIIIMSFIGLEITLLKFPYIQ